MGRSRLPKMEDGIVLGVHRYSSGVTGTERRWHRRKDGGADLIDWRGGRLPGEWIRFSREEVQKLAEALAATPEPR